MKFDKIRLPRGSRADRADTADRVVPACAPETETVCSGLFTVPVSPPPADLVTAERLKGVRFDLAQPRGYYTEQVDTLVKDLTGSLAWYEEGIYQRDQGIHSLQVDLDVAAAAEATLRAQMEVFRVQGSVTVGTDGQILRKSQMGPATDHPGAVLAEAQEALAVAELKLAASVEEVRSLREWADAVIPQTEQIAEGARLAQEQLEVTVQELTAERDHSATLTARVIDLTSELAAANTSAQALGTVSACPSDNVVAVEDSAVSVPVPAVVPDMAVNADNHVVAVSSDDMVAALDGRAPIPDPPAAPAPTRPADVNNESQDDQDLGDPQEPEWNLDDPELPVGVSLPRAKYDREYIPAGPGDPLLVERRSPLSVWAPELDSEPELEPGTPPPTEPDINPAPLSPATPAATAPDETLPGTAADTSWGDPLEGSTPIDVNATQVLILQGEARPVDVSDGIARPQLRRPV